MAHRLLQDTLNNASQGLTLNGPKYLGDRSIARPLASALKLLCRWFVKKRSSLDLDRSSRECMEELIEFFGASGVDALENGLKKLQRIRNPYRLDLEGPPLTPDSRMTIEVLRTANRMYEVRLRKVERLEGVTWSPIPLQAEAEPHPIPLLRYSLHELLLGRSSAITHLRCRVIATASLRSMSHPLFWIPEPPMVPGLLRIKLRVHEKPRGVEPVLKCVANDLSSAHLVVAFRPHLVAGQVAEYTIVIPHRNTGLFTAEAVRERDENPVYWTPIGLVTTLPVSVPIPTAVLEVLTVLPPGYEIADPSLDAKDAHRIAPLTDEIGRIYSAGGFTVRRRGVRSLLHLRVEHPVVGAYYSFRYRPPHEMSLPASLRDATPVAAPPEGSSLTRGTRSSRKPRRR